MDTTKLILLAVSVLICIIVLCAVFMLKDQGENSAKGAMESWSELEADLLEEYGSWNNKLCSGKEMKALYSGSADDLYWMIQTKELATLGSFLEGDSIATRFALATVTDADYINDDGNFLLTIMDEVKEGKIVVKAVQQ